MDTLSAFTDKHASDELAATFWPMFNSLLKECLTEMKIFVSSMNLDDPGWFLLFWELSHRSQTQKNSICSSSHWRSCSFFTSTMQFHFGYESVGNHRPFQF